MAESSLFERRTAAEWRLLQELAMANPARLANLRSEDDSFHFVLRKTPGLLADGSTASEHAVRITFPVHYPAVPMTLHLSRPVWHPNVHPATGFICLWRTHRVADTVEHALHKLVAMLGLRLYNADAVHVMQPDALREVKSHSAALQEKLQTKPLVGVVHESTSVLPTSSTTRRVRLS